jgi:hypothetical protein
MARKHFETLRWMKCVYTRKATDRLQHGWMKSESAATEIWSSDKVPQRDLSQDKRRSLEVKDDEKHKSQEACYCRS